MSPLEEMTNQFAAFLGQQAQQTDTAQLARLSYVQAHLVRVSLDALYHHLNNAGLLNDGEAIAVQLDAFKRAFEIMQQSQLVITQGGRA